MFRFRLQYSILNFGLLALLSAALIGLLVAVLPGCDKLPEVESDVLSDTVDAELELQDADANDQDMTEPTPWPQQWTVAIPPMAPPGVETTANQTVEILGMMGLSADTRVQDGETICTDGEALVVFAGQGLSRPRFVDTDNPQTWRITQETCGSSGVHVVLAGRSLLARQHAAYAWMHQELGVRFFHPEWTWTPAALSWPLRDFDEQHIPPFSRRGVRVDHAISDSGLTLEWADPAVENPQQAAENYVEWTVANLGTVAPSDSEPLAQLALDRGMGRQVEASLYGDLLDVASPPDAEVLEQTLAGLLDDNERNTLLLQVDAATVNTVDDALLEDQLNGLGAAIQQALPRATVFVTLPPALDDAWIGPRILSAMETAPTSVGVAFTVPGSADLQHTLRWNGDAQAAAMESIFVERPVAWMPDASMQNATTLPAYLPMVTAGLLDDLDQLRFMNEGRFGTWIANVGGQEWGAWQAHYCALRAPALHDYRLEHCLSDVLTPLGSTAPDTATVLLDYVSTQRRFLRSFTGATWLFEEPWLPPPALSELHDWRLAEVERWRNEIAPRLRRFADDSDDLLTALAVVSEDVPETGRAVFSEIFDGMQATGLRARHALHVWNAAIGLPRSRVFFEQEPLPGLLAELTLAEDATAALQLVLTARRDGYRYNLGDAVPAYLQDAHNTTFHRDLEQAVHTHVRGDLQAVGVSDVVLTTDEDLVLTAEDADELEVDFGDGSEPQTGTDLSHTYQETGIYRVSVKHTWETPQDEDMEDEDPPDGTTDPAQWEVESVFFVARVESELVTGFSGNAVAPEGADVVNVVLPGVVLGVVDDAALVFGVDETEAGRVGAHNFVEVPRAPGVEPPTTLPSRLVLAGVNHMGQYIFTSLILSNMVVTMDASGTRFEVTGLLRTLSAVEVIVEYAGFDEDGALELLAGVLGFPPDALPEQLDFLVEYNQQESMP